MSREENRLPRGSTNPQPSSHLWSYDWGQRSTVQTRTPPVYRDLLGRIEPPRFPPESGIIVSCTTRTRVPYWHLNQMPIRHSCPSSTADNNACPGRRTDYPEVPQIHSQALGYGLTIGGNLVLIRPAPRLCTATFWGGSNPPVFLPGHALLSAVLLGHKCLIGI